MLIKAASFPYHAIEYLKARNYNGNILVCFSLNMKIGTVLISEKVRFKTISLPQIVFAGLSTELKILIKDD